MSATILAIVTAIGLMLLIAGVALLVLRAIGRTGPHRDIEAWSVRSPDARSEQTRVAAQVQALRVEAGVVRRDYQPPVRQGGEAR